MNDMLTTENNQTETGHAVSNPSAFVTGGKAFFTLRSTKSGTRFTYKVTASEKGGSFFVSLLTGPDNWSNYAYIGFIGKDRSFRLTAKSNASADAPSVKAFDWTWTRLAAGKSIDGVEVWHEGKCARCGRKLTVPESIETGFGPDCAAKAGA